MSTSNTKMLSENRFKKAIANGETQIGLWCSLTSNLATEMIGEIGYDWLLLDAEHAPNDLGTLLPQLQGLRGSFSEPIVRTPWNDHVLVKRFMDIGFRTILFPYVQNEEEAAAAVAAMCYPPEGVRGVATLHRACSFGANADYFATANETACAIIQVETQSAAERLEAICKVPNLSGIFIGPADLAASMGHLGNPGHKDVQSLMRHCVDTCRTLGMPIGTLAPAQANAEKYLDWGYNFVAVGADLGLMRVAATEKLAAFKKA